jgi:hypothetical protein
VAPIPKKKSHQGGLKVNGAHELLAYADDVNPSGDNIDTNYKGKHRTLTDVSEDAALEVKADNIMYILLSRHQNAGPNIDINIANRFCSNVA